MPTSEQVQSAATQIQRSLGGYLLSLLLTDALLGVAVWIMYRLLGVHYAAAWGLAAALLHFVPFIGPTALAIGSIVFTAVQFESVVRGLLIGAGTIALAGLIGVVLQIWLSGRTARMNLIATFVTAMFWCWIWGLPGLVLGTPITIVFKAVCAQIPGLKWIDRLLSDNPRDGAPGGDVAPGKGSGRDRPSV